MSNTNENLMMLALAKAMQAQSAAGSAAAAAADAERAEAAAQEAMSGTPEGYSNIVGSIAETFSSSKAYAAGDYVLKDSVLYRFTAAHAAGAWTGSDATAVNLGDETSDLKSAIEYLEEGSLSALNANLGDVPVANGQGIWHWKGLGYVTPEMFGAKGDGVTDDTKAINDALEASKCVVLGLKTYKTTEPIYVPSNTVLMGMDKNLSKIYNTGTGWNKNIIVAGALDADSGTHGILHTDAVTYTKVDDYTFTCERNIPVNDIIHFKVTGTNDSISQYLSTSTYIVDKSGTTYKTFDPIPNEATLHLYGDIDDPDTNLKKYYTFGACIQNLTIEHLPTGSGMYCLYICGANFTVKDINIIGNTPLASNLAVHGLFENITATSYGDNLDCAEYVYYTDYKNINIRKAATNAETLHTQFAFGRGHDIKVSNFTSNILLPLAVQYTNKFIMEDSDIYVSEIAGTTNDIKFIRCKLMSTSDLNLKNYTYIDCYIQKPLLAAVNTAYCKNTVSDYDSIAAAAKEKIHLIDYEKNIFNLITTKTSYNVPIFDNAFMVEVTGENLSVSNGSASSTATAIVALYVTNGGVIRLKKDGGAVYGPGWANTGTFSFTGSITSIKQESLVMA